MQTTILWTGQKNHSFEHCIIDQYEVGPNIKGVIAGVFTDKIYRVDYQIKANEKWETLSVDIKYQLSDIIREIKLRSDGSGNWMLNDTPAAPFQGCIDVAISVTSFTNSLPVNRLRLAHNEQRQVKVLFIDLLNQERYPAVHQYTKLSDTEYHYKNIDHHFEALLQVDHSGFITDYPGLFIQTAAER